jgi:uncharacterized hydrophobic protein (TIGR00271 family)
MLRRNASEATSYWLQLLVSIGIATLGLVVGSTAVVIGAMLVAPLMGPIVGLAMGLATGSPFLVLRSSGRIAVSVITAIGGAAVITVLLPFHELNAEISARTSPTVLDLLTAAFCALAGVYASLRPGSDTTATAAGTSISISLVPPLCASGYGIGTGLWRVAGGAALLFLTNLVAIVVVGTIAFVASGFNRVGVVDLERVELEKGEDTPVARALARRLARLFETRGGPAFRFLMPFVLLGAVYVPLRRALDEVAWQVRVRTAVNDALARERAQVVHSRARVEHHSVEVVVVLLGKTSDAEAARSRLDSQIRQASGIVPRVEVLAIPDATAFAGLESTLQAPHDLSVQSLAAPSPDEQLETARARVRSAVRGVWPSAAVGEPLVIDVDTVKDALTLRVVHLGPTLGPDATEMFRKGVEAALERETALVDVPVPAAELTRGEGDLTFVSRVTSGVLATVGVPMVTVCVAEQAGPAGGRRPKKEDVELARAMGDVLAMHPRVTKTTGEEWSVRFVQGKCPLARAAMSDAIDPPAHAAAESRH